MHARPGSSNQKSFCNTKYDFKQEKGHISNMYPKKFVKFLIPKTYKQIHILQYF